jgi:signal transduction histidine kinase
MPEELVVQRALTGSELARVNRWVLVTSSVRGTVHTVNNILQTISGQAELLGQRPDLPEDARRRIDRIAAQTVRAADLMRELAALGREAPDAPDRADLRQMADRAYALRQYELSKNQVTVEVEGEPVGRCLATIDQQSLVLVLLNLLLNAQQALAGVPHATIRIEVGNRNSMLTIAVEDNGPGVPAADRERVFEPFYTTGRPGATLGLGLTVARLLVEEHHGRLDLADTAVGARFELSLPAAG